MVESNASSARMHDRSPGSANGSWASGTIWRFARKPRGADHVHEAHSGMVSTLRAITVSPGKGGSARLEDVPGPPRSDGAVLVRALALGICGTDQEIVSGQYGTSPPGEARLILGHESLGRV